MGFLKGFQLYTYIDQKDVAFKIISKWFDSRRKRLHNIKGCEFWWYILWLPMCYLLLFFNEVMWKNTLYSFLSVFVLLACIVLHTVTTVDESRRLRGDIGGHDVRKDGVDLRRSWAILYGVHTCKKKSLPLQRTGIFWYVVGDFAKKWLI